MSKSKHRRRPAQEPRTLPPGPRPPAAAGRAAAAVLPQLAEGMSLHRQGDLAGAKAAYCELLKAHPQHADGWHMLGMVLHQGGDSAAALECLQHACRFAPQPWPPELLCNLGLVYRAIGRRAEACEFLHRAVAARPTFADGWNTLGTLHLEQNEFPAAEHCFREALKHQPNHNHAWTNLGSALHHQRRYRESQDCHEESLRRFPHDVKTLNNLGAVLRAQRQNEAAAEAFRQAVALDPHAEEAQINLGRTLVALGKMSEAIGVFRSVIATQESSAAAHHHLGHALQLLDHHDDAIRCFQKAVELSPEYAQAISSLGNAKLQRGETEEGVSHLRRSLRLRPDLHETHSNLLFIMSSDERLSPAELFAEHVRWGQQHGVVEHPYRHIPNPDAVERKLRVGYVSPDLRDHAVARFFEPLLENFDRNRFEVYCYARIYKGDHVTDRLRQLTNHWRSTCGLSDEQTAEMIHEDQIDLLVDLAGHTAGHRLLAFAHKPAPVQITWLGYPNTTGLPAMDYRLTSEIQDPSNEPTYHTETLVRLECGTNVYAAPSTAPEVQPPPCLRNGYVTFGSLHRPQKISPDVYQLWGDVMRANPTARLRIYNTGFNADARKLACEQLRQQGLAEDRFTIENCTRHEHYFHEYHDIDIGLDVFPWNGGTTTREAMWMGVPVIGLLGGRRSSRGTAATLHYAGFPELIARSSEAYVKLATELAQDPKRLQELRMCMRPQMRDTICNAARFTRCLEATYRELWRRWCLSTAAEPAEASR